MRKVVYIGIIVIGISLLSSVLVEGISFTQEEYEEILTLPSLTSFESGNGIIDFGVGFSEFAIRSGYFENLQLPPSETSLEGYNIEPFIYEELLPQEIRYFTPDVGIDSNSGIVYDHLRILPESGKIIQVGKYSAPSKFSLQIPVLLGVIQQKPGFEQVDMTPDEARNIMESMFETFSQFIQEYPDYGGFIPWVEIQSNGRIKPSDNMLPSLDNGEFTWALAAVVSGLRNSPNEKDSNLADMAEDILNMQDYSKFYDSKRGLVHGAVEVNPKTGKWYGTGYYLTDMFEGIMAILWGVLHGQIPEEAWDKIKIPTVEYTTQAGEKITTFLGFRASFHEHWALGYLPLMKSKLAPLYKNFLYAQADYAHKNGLPGFLSTAYDPKGAYRQMGIPEIAAQPVDRSDVAVGFATAMGMLIEPEVSARWLKNYYKFPGILTPYGVVESVASDGYADILTADGKGMTILASTGGVVPEIEQYLKNHIVPGTDITMYDKLMQLLDNKYEQMMEQRHNRPIQMPTYPYPLPSEEQITVEIEEMPAIGPEFNISACLQPGHLHGKNVNSIGSSTLKDDIRPDGIFEFEFNIPSYGDQWAFRGTYLDKAVGIADMNYLVVSIPADSLPHLFDIELKRDDMLLAVARINTTQEGVISEDGKWKTIAVEINPHPDAKIYPLNYIAVAIHDPKNLPDKFKPYARQGTIRLKDIKLTQYHPFLEEVKYEGMVPPVEGENEIVQYWSPSHGDLKIIEDKGRNVIRFKGGRGWRGGYVPATDISKYRYAVVKVRNLSGRPNSFYLELKYEGTNLLGGKRKIKLSPGGKWQIIRVSLPSHISQPLNYLAISDPLDDFELSSIAFIK